MNFFFFFLLSGFEDLYAVAEVRNSPCTVPPQPLPSEWQVAVLPLLGYGYHHFALMLLCLKLLNQARIHQELF